MVALPEAPTMAKKKTAAKSSESRKHTGVARMDRATLERAMLAASLMRMSLADYLTQLVAKHVETDISREAKKLTGGPK